MFTRGRIDQRPTPPNPWEDTPDQKEAKRINNNASREMFAALLRAGGEFHVIIPGVDIAMKFNPANDHETELGFEAREKLAQAILEGKKNV